MEDFAITIDDATALDPDIGRFFNPDEMPVAPFFVHQDTSCWIVFQSWRSEQCRARHERQGGIRPDRDRAGQKTSRRDDHFAAPLSGNLIESGLDGTRIQGCPVANGPELGDEEGAVGKRRAGHD